MSLKNPVAILLKLCISVVLVVFTTAAAWFFAFAVIGAFCFVYPVGELGEAIAILLLYGLCAGGFAVGVYLSKGIWRPTGVEGDNEKAFDFTLVFAIIFLFFCAVVGAVICTYVGYTMHIQLPNIITNAIVEGDRGESTLMEIYAVIGLIVGLWFGFMIIRKKLG